MVAGSAATSQQEKQHSKVHNGSWGASKPGPDCELYKEQQ